MNDKIDRTGFTPIPDADDAEKNRDGETSNGGGR